MTTIYSEMTDAELKAELARGREEEREVRAYLWNREIVFDGGSYLSVHWRQGGRRAKTSLTHYNLFRHMQPKDWLKSASKSFEEQGLLVHLQRSPAEWA